MLVYAARFVLPVRSAPITNGAVAIEDGRVVHVGTRSAVVEATGATELHDLGDVALMPGLINAHTHVELSWMVDDPPRGGDYATWLRSFLDRRDREDPQVAAGAAKRALQAIRSRGTVAIGDVANGTWLPRLLQGSGLRGVLFFELLGIRSSEAETRLAAAAEELEAMNGAMRAAGEPRFRIVITPHAPHTTSGSLLRALAGRSAAAAEPLSIHLAESREETAMLLDGTGPLPELFRERGFADDGWEPPGHRPVDLVDRLGVLGERTLAVHCVDLRQRDHSKLQTRGVTVVTCPRSNRRIGVGRAPIPQLLGEGIPVALGTDSLASAPDLDLFAEIVALREEHPAISRAAALRMATLNGAQALGLSGDLGSIEPGKLAELIVVPLASADDDPLETICSNPETVIRLADAPRIAAS